MLIKKKPQEITLQANNSYNWKHMGLFSNLFLLEISAAEAKDIFFKKKKQNFSKHKQN
jgi:hypothetical protein